MSPLHGIFMQPVVESPPVAHETSKCDGDKHCACPCIVCRIHRHNDPTRVLDWLESILGEPRGRVDRLLYGRSAHEAPVPQHLLCFDYRSERVRQCHTGPLRVDWAFGVRR